ncbi:MAG TPA: gliding motility-associated C-terminal domain-containing protein, partial [Chitinophagaceae bacterium]|nr:gliding motility-associated C-terminal domain-containing protein [Chitinophagaceae bacterium]
PVAAGMQQVQHFQVFNRWGQLVYRMPNSHHAGWDGRVNGTLQSTGTYVWTIQALDYLGKPYTQKGTVTLIK